MAQGQRGNVAVTALLCQRNSSPQHTSAMTDVPSRGSRGKGARAASRDCHAARLGSSTPRMTLKRRRAAATWDGYQDGVCL